MALIETTDSNEIKSAQTKIKNLKLTTKFYPYEAEKLLI